MDKQSTGGTQGCFHGLCLCPAPTHSLLLHLPRKGSSDRCAPTNFTDEDLPKRSWKLFQGKFEGQINQSYLMR